MSIPHTGLSDRIVTVPNVLSVVRLLFIPLFLYLFLEIGRAHV